MLNIKICKVEHYLYNSFTDLNYELQASSHFHARSNLNNRLCVKIGIFTDFCDYKWQKSANFQNFQKSILQVVNHDIMITWCKF